MGSSSKKVTSGYRYKLIFHHGLGVGPIDAFLEFRGGNKVAWKGEINQTTIIAVNEPKLWGGEKDQGGVVGDLEVLFGDAAQQPNATLIAQIGDQQPAWRGLATLVYLGEYGSNNPYPQKPAYKFRKITEGWDDSCWYEDKAEIPNILSAISPFNVPVGVVGSDDINTTQRRPGYLDQIPSAITGATTWDNTFEIDYLHKLLSGRIIATSNGEEKLIGTDDGGRNWVTLTNDFTNGNNPSPSVEMIYPSIGQLPSGRIILRNRLVGMEYSDDDGDTWQQAVDWTGTPFLEPEALGQISDSFADGIQ